MLVMVVFFIAFRWIHLSTPLIRLFLLVLILLLMPTLNFLPVWFALSLLRFRLPSRLPMMFILRSEERRVGKECRSRGSAWDFKIRFAFSQWEPEELGTIGHLIENVYLRKLIGLKHDISK